MDITYHENSLLPEDLASFRNQVGWGTTTVPQAEKALANTLFSICAKEGDKVVGMGRLVGDGVLIWYIQDLIILPAFQGKGIGGACVRMLMGHALTHGVAGSETMIGLMAAKGKEPFYEKLGFGLRPNDSEGAGMIFRK